MIIKLIYNPFFDHSSRIFRIIPKFELNKLNLLVGKFGHYKFVSTNQDEIKVPTFSEWKKEKLSL